MAKINILDFGYVEFIEHWGSDESIITSARMSTDKGFNGWGGSICTTCDKEERLDPKDYLFKNYDSQEKARSCKECNGTGKTQGDEKLLKHLYTNKHMTPFEMGGLVIEVKAPIFVFREWHRHRVFSFNEMSARYIPLPDENYIPTIDRLMSGANTATTNKQAQGNGKILTEPDALEWLAALADVYDHAQSVYQLGISLGVPKELARLPVPVARYSRMRASANLRNWLGFLTLRQAPQAQWEIRVYADVVASILIARFPRTMELFQNSEA